MDKLFTSNIEDNEIFFSTNEEVEEIRPIDEGVEKIHVRTV